MKVAFATQDLKRVDAHFGWAKNIAIYEVNPEGNEFLEAIQFDGDLQEDGNEDKLAPKNRDDQGLRHPLCCSDWGFGGRQGGGSQDSPDQGSPTRGDFGSVTETIGRFERNASALVTKSHDEGKAKRY